MFDREEIKKRTNKGPFMKRILLVTALGGLLAISGKGKAEELDRREQLYRGYVQRVIAYFERNYDRKKMEQIIREAVKISEKETGVDQRIPLKFALMHNWSECGKEYKDYWNGKVRPEDRAFAFGAGMVIVMPRNPSESDLQNYNVPVNVQMDAGNYLQGVGRTTRVGENKLLDSYNKCTTTISSESVAMAFGTTADNMRAAAETVIEKVKNNDADPTCIVKGGDGTEFLMSPSQYEDKPEKFGGVQITCPGSVFK